jgi:thioredoxin 1
MLPCLKIMFNRLLQKLGVTAPQPNAKAKVTVPERTAPIIDVTDATFVDIVLASDKLAVVDFWAEWCQPCQIMSAYVGFLAQEYGDRLLLAALDVDENPQIPDRYTIMGLPTLLLLRNGEEVDRIVGVEEYSAIKARVEQWLTT